MRHIDPTPFPAMRSSPDAASLWGSPEQRGYLLLDDLVGSAVELELRANPEPGEARPAWH